MLQPDQHAATQGSPDRHARQPGTCCCRAFGGRAATGIAGRVVSGTGEHRSIPGQDRQLEAGAVSRESPRPHEGAGALEVAGGKELAYRAACPQAGSSRGAADARQFPSASGKTAHCPAEFISCFCLSVAFLSEARPPAWLCCVVKTPGLRQASPSPSSGRQRAGLGGSTRSARCSQEGPRVPAGAALLAQPSEAQSAGTVTDTLGDTWNRGGKDEHR